MLTLYYNGVFSAPVAEFDVTEVEALKLIYEFESVTTSAVDSYRRDWVYERADGTKLSPCGMPGGVVWEIIG